MSGKHKEICIFTDGGARGNPGPAGIGVVVTSEDTTSVLEKFGRYIGVATNNRAEYQGIKAGLEAGLKYNPTKIRCYLDSELVVHQLNGKYRVKNADLAAIFTEVQELAKQADVTFSHIYREKNKLADFEVNQAIDKATK